MRSLAGQSDVSKIFSPASQPGRSVASILLHVQCGVPDIAWIGLHRVPVECLLVCYCLFACLAGVVDSMSEVLDTVNIYTHSTTSKESLANCIAIHSRSS